MQKKYGKKLSFGTEFIYGGQKGEATNKSSQKGEETFLLKMLK